MSFTNILHNTLTLCVTIMTIAMSGCNANDYIRAELLDTDWYSAEHDMCLRLGSDFQAHLVETFTEDSSHHWYAGWDIQPDGDVKLTSPTTPVVFGTFNYEPTGQGYWLDFKPSPTVALLKPELDLNGQVTPNNCTVEL